MTDTELLNELQGLLSPNYCKISFNFDKEDGYFAEVYRTYALEPKFPDVADLSLHTKRKTLRAAMVAACEYLRNPPR